MTVFEYNFTIKKGSKGYIIEGVLKEAYMYICTDSTANATQDKMHSCYFWAVWISNKQSKDRIKFAHSGKSNASFLPADDTAAPVFRGSLTLSVGLTPKSWLMN